MVELADMGDSKPLGSNTVQVQVLLGAPYYAPLAQLVEATGLSPVQSEFESLEGYHIMSPMRLTSRRRGIRFSLSFDTQRRLVRTGQCWGWG